MKKIFSLHLNLIKRLRFIFIGLIAQSAFAQDISFDWANKYGGFIAQICVDDDHNTFVVGNFTTTIDLDPGIAEQLVTPAGESDFYISKFDSSGNLLWAHSFAGTTDDRGSGIQCDNQGNVVISGFFTSNIDFDPGSGIYPLSSQGEFDVFILKLTTDGEFLWAKSFGGAGRQTNNSLIIDGESNLVLFGDFWNTPDFDPGSSVYNITSFSNALSDCYIVKLDSTANFIWAKSLSGISAERITGLVSDAANNILVAGSFQLSVDFDPGPSTNILTTSNNMSDAFILKLSVEGNSIWVKIFSSELMNRATGICVDQTGNIYLAGVMGAGTDFDPGSGTYLSTFSGACISKFDADGNFIWLAEFNDIFINDIISDKGIIYSTGSFDGMIDFDPGPGTFNLLNVGSYDAFINIIDENGEFIWASKIGSSLSDSGSGVYVLDNELYVAGYFTGSADIDPTSGNYILNSGSNAEAFILSLNTCLLDEPQLTLLGATIVSNQNGEFYQWLNCLNLEPIPGANSQQFSPTENGQYALRVTQGNCTYTSACLQVSNAGLQTLSSGSEISIYPNPTDNTATVFLGEVLERINYTLTTVSGQVIEQQSGLSGEKFSVDLSHQAGGIYFLTLNMDGNKYVFKLVKGL